MDTEAIKRHGVTKTRMAAFAFTLLLAAPAMAQNPPVDDSFSDETVGTHPSRGGDTGPRPDLRGTRAVLWFAGPRDLVDATLVGSLIDGDASMVSIPLSADAVRVEIHGAARTVLNQTHIASGEVTFGVRAGTVGRGVRIAAQWSGTITPPSQLGRGELFDLPFARMDRLGMLEGPFTLHVLHPQYGRGKVRVLKGSNSLIIEQAL